MRFAIATTMALHEIIHKRFLQKFFNYLKIDP